MGVGDRSKQVATMLSESQGVADIIAGGENMRSNGKTYLPKFPAESEEDYSSRLASTWLFNGVRKARDDFSGRIFEKPVVLSDQQGPLFDWAQNIDMEGRDLSNFAADVFKASLARGISFIMADAPPREGELTRGQVQQMGWRPYLVSLTLDQVLGWKWELQNNTPVLTQFRILEQVEDPDRGRFDDDVIDQVRLLELVEGRVQVELYRKLSGKGFELHETYSTDMTQIMVAPVYTGRTGYFTAKTPLSELGELNLAHWRVQSDKASCLHKSLSPLLFFKNMAEVGESGSAVINSAGYGFTGNAENSDMKWVEITGSGIEAGDRELAEIKSQMQQMGLQLITEKVGVTTATGESIQEGKSVSRLRMWADDLKDALEIALGWMAELGGITANTDVVVNKEFGVLSATVFTEVREMYRDGVISRETYIAEAKRRGIIDESVMADDDAEFSETEGLDDFSDEIDPVDE